MSLEEKRKHESESDEDIEKDAKKFLAEDKAELGVEKTENKEALSDISLATIKPRISSSISNESASKKTLNPFDSIHVLQNQNAKYLDHFSRILSDDFEQAPYKRRKGEDKTTVHFGQRKLLLSEIEFLTISVNEILADSSLNGKKIIVIYAGAAPGHHIPLLVNMFPFFEYFLVDPADFKLDDRSYKAKVEMKNAYFDDEMATALRNKYKDYEILFISDIRTANYRVLTRLDTELKVEQDMEDQMRWVKILKPLKSILKFRLPYVGLEKVTKTELEYLDGKIYFQVWPGCTSSETRLIVDRDVKTKMYDCIKYENQLFRFNTVERVSCYQHDARAYGIDHCYDCKAEVHILSEYLNSIGNVLTMAKMNDVTLDIKERSVNDLIKLVNKSLNAWSRFVLITYNQVNYDVRFTDMFYGQEKRNVFRDSKIVKDLDAYFRNNKNDDDEEESKHVKPPIRNSNFNRGNYRYSTLPFMKQRKLN